MNEAIVHGIPGDRVLEPGDIVSVDTGCKFNGWCGDAAVTHAIGKISGEARRLLEVTQGVLELAIERMGHAKLWSEVAAEMEAYVQKAGFTVIEDFVGHGVGRDMHEEPQVPNYGKPNTGPRIKIGLVVAIEPMINMGKYEVKKESDGFTITTADELPSAHYEHTIAIRREKAEILSTFQYIEKALHKDA
ncbi:MAG: type I methionyl aminopeptidase, partial [Proteobacteria bacterium]|nr:type I methionyl aminopeptidase [Pseudomonadota bacterium]